MISKGWVKKLFEEIKQWQSEGLIDEPLLKVIKSRYQERLEYNRLINTIVTLGSILIGLGILLFVASNWDKLNRPFKIIIIFSVIIAFNYAGYYFRCKKVDYPGLGEGFLLIAAFSFGAGIWLIAQIFQIHYNFSAGILYWILGILPFVIICRSWMILALSSVLSCFWLCSYFSYYPQRTGYGFFLLAGILLILIYLRKQRFSLFALIVGFSIWLGHFWLFSFEKSFYDQETVLIAQVALVTIYSLFGIILYGLGLGHARSEKLSVFSFLYKFLGIIFITLSNYSLTFAHHYDEGAVFYMPLKIVLLFIALFVPAFLIFYRLHLNPAAKSEGKEIGLLVWFIFLQAIAVTLSLSWVQAISLGYNLILFFQILTFIYLGFIRHSESIFRLAIIIFFLHTLSRYFDIFWKMMPRSLLFIFGGILLISGAVYANKKRRELEKKMIEEVL